MDLRVQRTQKNIKEAFYKLRKKKNLDKISVKELSEKAMINKATFYLHYESVYDLSKKLKNELISEIIGEVRGYNLREGREQFRLFAENLSRAIIAHSKEIDMLYKGDDSNDFVNRLEDRLREYIFMTFPNIPNNNDFNIMLTLFVQGSFHCHIRHSNISPDILVSKTTALFMKLLNV